MSSLTWQIGASGPSLVAQVPYVRSSSPEVREQIAVLEVLRFPSSHLTSPSALVITGDLQFWSFASSEGPRVPLGARLCEELARLSVQHVLPAPSDVIVILTGDLYADEVGTKGASGPVQMVWRAFHRSFPWVVGVLGNHDEVDEGFRRLATGPEAFPRLLDASIVQVGGLRVAGVAGIVGNPRKPGRRREEDYLEVVRQMGAMNPDVLVMHESPSGLGAGQPGNQRLRELCDNMPPMLVCCGHVHWSSPVARLASGTVIVNAETRCVILAR